MRLTRAGEYAVRCVLYLASQGVGVLCARKEIARTMDIPDQFLGKIAQQLARAGAIEIIQGARGGFRLVVAPEQLTLLEVVEAVIGEIFLNDCVMRPESCNRSHACAVHCIWAKARDQLRQTLQEATFARMAFPCWDEPDLKAVFGVTLIVPDGLLAISNGPEVERTAVHDDRVRVRFADTMPMSTYLAAFVVGPLEATEPVDVDGVPLRIVHVPGKGNLAAFALEVGAFSLRFFADYYGIPYPDRKLDMVALPDFAQGAMENLGCITYREVALLVDPAKATQQELQGVADTIAHSPLVKTALFGEDANWGRILAAAGRSGAALDPGRVDIYIGPVQMVSQGIGCGKEVEAAATRVLKTDEFSITIDLHLGPGQAAVYTCDLSIDYVKINADYRS